jgi:protein tyrosine phosphatase (PTP) superfamily phosphohydrolase (DUF442 family)
MTRATIILVSMVLVWAIVYYTYWVIIRRRFVAIVPGRVYQSGAMWPWWLIRSARRYAIQTVIDFRGAHEEETQIQARALADTGIRYINIPIGALPAQSDVRRFIHVMNEELSAGRRVLMHCRDGEGRAIAMAAIYRIEFEGWSALEAYRGGTRLPPGFKFVSLLFPGAGLLSQRNCKTRFILEYQPTRPASSARADAYVSEAGI